jgi:protocatechuate 3,4-dioxygenase beta subunit
MPRHLSTFLVLLLLSCGAMAQSQDAKPPAPKKDQCRIAGTVVTLAGSEPLRKARVRLESQEDRTRSISAVTDSGGHFELKALDPGGYRLHVTRVGYVTQIYGQRKPQDPGAILSLGPGQDVKDLIFKMTPAAVIAGRILDEDGEPLPSVTVGAMREAYSEGKRNLVMGANAQSDDRGEYRLFGLPPGRYFISARYGNWERGIGESEEQTQQSSQGYAKMFYPGTPDRTKATPIVVKAGEEIPSVEILMPQVSVYHVRGRVYNQITHRPGTDSFVVLVPKTAQREEFGDLYTIVQKRDGSFDIPDILPGSYSLTGFWADQGRQYLSRTPIEVGNADVEGVTITIAPGTIVSGRVIWDGQPALDRDELQISVQPTDNTPFFFPGSRVSADGAFTLMDVGDGAYYAITGGESKDCYVKDVEYAGRASLEDGFNVVRGSAASLEITISSRGARVQGAVTDDDGLPTPGVWVALVPESETRRTKHRLYKSQTTDQYGHFDLRGIAPGEYFLFSWTEAEDGAWEDPEFMKPFLEKKKGASVSVQDGDTKSMNLVAIKNASTEQQKP